MGSTEKKTAKQYSRRQFAKQSATATAGLVVPYFVPSSVLGSPGNPGANDRVHIGLIACGGRGEALMKSLPKTGQVVAVCDCDTSKMEGLLKRKNNAKLPMYQDYRKMIDQQKMDAVMVATVDHARVLACILACQAGLDIYAEKPLTLTIGEGQAFDQSSKKVPTCFAGRHATTLDGSRPLGSRQDSRRRDRQDQDRGGSPVQVAFFL